MHINTNASCGTQNANRTTTMRMEYSMYRGGVADGYADATFDQGPNPALAMYRGGNDDGFSLASIDQGPNPALTMYRGGNDDGFTLSSYEQCDGTMTRWYGSISIDWHNFQNWECGILPTLTSDVIISGGAHLFPTVSAHDEIRSLLMMPGSSIIISPPAVLTLNGL